METASGPTSVVLAPECFDAVVFDMDGVITDTAGVHFAAWKEMFDEFLDEHSRMPGAAACFDEDDYRNYVDGKQRDDGVESFLATRLGSSFLVVPFPTRLSNRQFGGSRTARTNASRQ